MRCDDILLALLCLFLVLSGAFGYLSYELYQTVRAQEQLLDARPVELRVVRHGDPAMKGQLDCLETIHPAVRIRRALHECRVGPRR